MLEWIHKQLSKSLIRRVKNFVDTSLELGYGNEQWFLDFLDELNKVKNEDK